MVYLGRTGQPNHVPPPGRIHPLGPPRRSIAQALPPISFTLNIFGPHKTPPYSVIYGETYGVIYDTTMQKIQGLDGAFLNTTFNIQLPGMWYSASFEFQLQQNNYYHNEYLA